MDKKKYYLQKSLDGKWTVPCITEKCEEQLNIRDYKLLLKSLNGI